MASVMSNMLLKWVPDFSSCQKICLCNPWVTRVKFVLVFTGNLKVNLQKLEMLVFRKTIRDVSLPELTLLDGSRGHLPWRHLVYTCLPFVCLFSGGAGGVTEPTSFLPAAKIPFLTITEKMPLWNCYCFKPWVINYFSQTESFLECLYPAFALHNASLCICTHEFIVLAYRISLCRGLWVSGANNALLQEAWCPPQQLLQGEKCCWALSVSDISPKQHAFNTRTKPNPDKTESSTELPASPHWREEHRGNKA